jgi:signal transduction histidine kinase
MTPRILDGDGRPGLRGRRQPEPGRPALRGRREPEPGRPARRGAPSELDSTNSLLVHDIKNLSFRLCALLQNLEKHYEDPLFKKTVVDILTDTVNRMDRIIHRCQGPRDDLIVKYPVDINEILHDVMNRLVPTGGKKFFLEESYDRIPKVWADPKYLKEAFSLVTDNAMEAMAVHGGRISVATTSRTTRSGQRKVVVKISDTGPGMSREFIRTRLFAPFVSTKEHGLGLGMYACRKIIAMHEGTVRVSSREGHGTSFRIDFPAAK